MQPPRLTLKSLWRMYHGAQTLLQHGSVEAAAAQFHRIAAARLRRPRGRKEEGFCDENPLVAQARLGLCYCYIEGGQLEDALGELGQVLELEPHNPEALCELAYIETMRGHRSEAKCALEDAVQHNPNSARALKALGYFYLQESEFDKAIEACRAAVKCDPGYDPAYLELAVALNKSGRTDEAVSTMARALRLAPENPDYYHTMSSLLRELHRYNDAETVLAMGLELDPKNGELLEEMAELQLEAGEPERAIEYAQRLLRHISKSLAARDVLGVAYLQQGRIHEALRMADQMVSINPLDPSHHFKKAVLFQQQGMLREALAEFAQVANLAMGSDMAEEAYEAIESMDNHQMRQIILLATEDPVFRVRLRRDAVGAAGERGFHLSEAGFSALQSVDMDGLAAHHPGTLPVHVH